MKNIRIKLTIALADGGKSARDILEMYSANTVDDIDQIAWNECGCDDQLQKQKFTELKLARWSVKQNRSGNLEITASFSALVESVEFAEHVITQYMDGFADSLSSTTNALYSRTGVRSGFNPNPIEWDVDIK